VGDEEISSHTVKLKNMATGEQQNLGINEAMVLLKKV
jgi:histidyl-tRNA synthetase